MQNSVCHCTYFTRELVGGKASRLKLPVVASLLLSVWATANAEQSDCMSVQSIEQSGREFVSESLGYQGTKQKLINSLLKQSVEQILGKQITANSRSELKVQNDELEESLRTMSVERAKGFVTGYRVLPPGEDIVDMGGVAVMQLRLTADVCIPKYRGANYVVAIGDVLMADGMPIPPGVIESIVAEMTKNPRFSTIRFPVPSGTYYDYVLTGRVKGSTKQEIPNITGKLSNKLSNKLLRSITKREQRVDDKVVQTTVEIALQLEDIVDKTVSNYIGAGTHTMSMRASQSEEAAATISAMDKAAVDAIKIIMKKF